MKYIYLIIIALFSFNNLYAQPDCFPDDPDCNPNPPGEGTGGRTVPIDDYAPILVITATMVAAVYSQRKKQLFKK